jgi:hypothetical protein
LRRHLEWQVPITPPAESAALVKLQSDEQKDRSAIATLRREVISLQGRVKDLTDDVQALRSKLGQEGKRKAGLDAGDVAKIVKKHLVDFAKTLEANREAYAPAKSKLAQGDVAEAHPQLLSFVTKQNSEMFDVLLHHDRQPQQPASSAQSDVIAAALSIAQPLARQIAQQIVQNMAPATPLAPVQSPWFHSAAPLSPMQMGRMMPAPQQSSTQSQAGYCLGGMVGVESQQTWPTHSPDVYAEFQAFLAQRK